MRKVLLGPMFGAIVTLTAIVDAPLSGESSTQARAAAQDVTKADLERWKKELSNWGRWGAEDDRGALNLITPAKRKQAAALVREGFVVSLARDMDTEKAPDNQNPLEHTMTGIGGDRIAIAPHGWGNTHLDSLAHANDQGVFYNGYKPDRDAVMKSGHTRNSVHIVKNGIFTRGVLIDIPRLKGVEYLEPSTRIYPQDLEAWEKKVGVKVSAGDALFVRTGRWVRRAKLGPWEVGKQAAGLDASCIPWLKQRDIALIGTEEAVDVIPSSAELPNQPVHAFLMVYLGVQVLDDAELTAVSEAAAARKRWEFLVTISPLAVRGGTGSPINPTAIF